MSAQGTAGAGGPASAGAPEPSAERAPGRMDWLPDALRPREREDTGNGTMRLIETTLLVLAGVLLLIATVNDLSRQVGVNHRLNADTATWRAYTGHDYRNLDISQELLGASSGREVVCGNSAPGAPRSRTQVCLMIGGPTVSGRRQVQGGWLIPPGSEDQKPTRYACFGAAVQESLCPR